MKAWQIVGPTNLNPLRFRSLLELLAHAPKAEIMANQAQPREPRIGWAFSSL
jgi:hypothetical protein